jgi:DNA-binding SARP family transcriptional activator
MRGEAGEGMRFEILGPMRVAEGRETRPVAGARQRTVLAALLERANQPVPAGQLAEVVWDGAQAAARILTQDNGYLARVAEAELDALFFEAQCRRTDVAARAADWSRVAECAENALAVWRGAPLADVPSQALHEAWLPRLEQQRLQAREWQAEAALHLGRNEELIQPLRELTAEHPLRERFHAQLMLALYRTGRAAEALAAYHDARRVLVETLGIEPGPDLRALHARILAGDAEPSLTGLLIEHRRAAGPGSPVTSVAPRQLPAAAQHFTGRQAELELLVDRLGPSSQRPDFGGTVVISAIDGMAGIGKTALAVCAAHRLAGRFPDGQLFLDLHGYTQGQPPRTAGEALAWLLGSLGVPPERIPADGEQAAAL